MAELFTTKQVKAAVWDFAQDGSGFATIPLGVIIPAFSIITNCYVSQGLNLVSGGACELSFGFTGGSDFDMLTARQAYSNFNAVGGANKPVVQGHNFMLQPLQLGSSDREVSMTIITAAMTQGRLICFIEYTKSPY